MTKTIQVGSSEQNVETQVLLSGLILQMQLLISSEQRHKRYYWEVSSNCGHECQTIGENLRNIKIFSNIEKI